MLFKFLFSHLRFHMADDSPTVTIEVESNDDAPAPESVSTQAAEIVETAADLAEKMNRSSDDTNLILSRLDDLRQLIVGESESLRLRLENIEQSTGALLTARVLEVDEAVDVGEKIIDTAEELTEVAEKVAEETTEAAETTEETEPERRDEKQSKKRRWL